MIIIIKLNDVTQSSLSKKNYQIIIDALINEGKYFEEK